MNVHSNLQSLYYTTMILTRYFLMYNIRGDPMNNRWSVRKLVEFTMRSGDIDNGLFSNRRALEGIRLHQKLQNQYSDGFESEVTISGEVVYGDTSIFLEGRIDGVDNKHHILDEIKSTIYTKEAIDKRPNALHWAQLKCYGYLYCKSRELDEVGLRLSYIRVEDESVFRYEKVFTREELSEFMSEVMERLIKIQSRLESFQDLMKSSVQSLAFPYGDFRPGQREMAVSVYNMVQAKETIFIQAPTGIGKTLATLFPAIKGIGEELSEEIFYATGRSTQKTVAMETLDFLEQKGLRMKSVELVAKEKACLNDTVDCRPEACPYAKGHYDRLLEGILAIYDNEDIFDGHTIRVYSEKHMLCPFEFGLDLSNFAQILVGDYNYIFHPKTYLERLMVDRDRTKATTLLIDEAHNLIDRARDMYSAKLSLNLMDDVKFKDKEVKKAAESFRKVFKEIAKTPNLAMEELPEVFHDRLEDLEESMAKVLARATEEPPEEWMELYFAILDWQNRKLYYNKERFTYFVPEKNTLSILCLDPSQVLWERRNLFGGVIYFSATLSPMNYHREILGGGEDAHHLILPSPFDPSHLLVLHPSSVSTKYRDRERTLPLVRDYLRTFTESSKGNFIHFFPSYAYKDQVLEGIKDPYLLNQERAMTERERKNFIGRFFNEETVHGYAVMGGVFSEGIDLVGNALRGVSILTLSLPGLSPERELIKNRFNEMGKDGYAYAYIYPGITKVVQAAGRIIRRDTDRGQLLLLDDRFARKDIRALLPPEWQIQIIRSPEDMTEKIKDFWRYL